MKEFLFSNARVGGFKKLLLEGLFSKKKFSLYKEDIKELHEQNKNKQKTLENLINIANATEAK